MKIHELFSDPRKWTQGAYARDKEHRHITEVGQIPVCFCLLGALRWCYSNGKHQDYAAVCKKLSDRFESDKHHWQTAVLNWNDTPGRTHEEVLALVKELDI